ncbi:endosome-associated-trafficking regulator 1 isoform X3 [Platichthys flesus]|uniref:endosome-associated-trafficking regulator 1 isoform X3 n=1 Tax=Platichthys flesus TaxID=8260 RepID=UPI002DBF5A73|nr:endosome-associated-trafficking regulator 1 isoform X3 [Platichthys flesus]
MSGHRTRKSLIITDDEEVKGEELNPFSFKEFLRLKDQDPDPDREQTHSEEEEDKDWGWGFQCVASSSSPLSEETTRFTSEPDIKPKGGGDNEGDDEMSTTEPIISFRGRSDIQLKEENMALRRTIRELQSRSDAKEHRVQELSEELLQRTRQEEKEAEDLESMVHSVEQNLHLMTVEAESLRSENEALKAAETQVVMTMRQTALVASEYLNKMASHAHSSIRQLLGEAETLRLVSHLLRSIDKISEC